MKTILTAILFTVCLIPQAQVLSEADRITRLEDNLTAMNREYTTGAWLVVGGALLSAINIYTIAQDDGGSQQGLGIAGAVCIATGTAFIIDSHKHLNINKVAKKKL